MKKLFLTLLMFSSIVYSQENEVQNKFILHLLNEDILIVKNEQNDRNFDPEKLNIELDTLDSNHYVDVLFLKFKFGESSINVKDNKLEINYNNSSCNEYVLAYNIVNRNSYRLKGFNGNDLLFLIKDLEGLSYTPNTIKKIVADLNELNIGIDFKAIYKALMRLDFNAECLRTCSEGKEAHGKIK